MAPHLLPLPKSLFTITEDNNVPMSSCQQQEQQEKEAYSVPLSSSTAAATLQLSTSFVSSVLSSSSTSTSTRPSNRTGSTSLKRNLRRLSNVLDVLDSNPTSTSAATTLEEKFDATFARWEANATSSSIFASRFHQSDGDPPPTRPLRRLSPAT